jgi:hypothetical protein
MADDDNGLPELRTAIGDLHRAVMALREQRNTWTLPQPATQLPSAASESWNFTTFEKYINQRFTDMALQLRERYEAQQTGVTAALAAAEKAVNAALIAAEKAVDKAEGAQQLRNEAQNEFRKSLSDLSALMWTIKEGTLAVDSVRRELGQQLSTFGDRVQAMERNSIGIVAHDAVEKRIGLLETGAAKIQGRIWAVSALFALVALGLEFGSRYVGHG